MIKKLITIQDVLKVKQVSTSLTEIEFNQFVIEAQTVDLLPLLGECFYNDLLRNTENYQDLLNGCEYEFNDQTYTNVGIKTMLSYYTYARFAKFANVVATPHGLVSKKTSESEPVSDLTRNSLYKHNQQIAFSFWNNILLYINRTGQMPDRCRPKNFCGRKNKGIRLVRKIN